MIKKEFTNLKSQINNLLDEYTTKHNELNNAYSPVFAILNKKHKLFKWLFRYSSIIFVVLLYFSYYLYFHKEFIFIISIIPSVIGIIICFFIHLKFHKIIHKKLSLEKEYSKEITEINKLDSVITNLMNQAVNMILDELAFDKDEVIRIIGTSYNDLLEYFDYYCEFIQVHPDIKPEIKRIKEKKYSFEDKTNLSLDAFMDALIKDITKDNLIDIIHIINNIKINERFDVIGYLLSFITNAEYPTPIIIDAINLLRLKKTSYELSGYYFYFYQRDISFYNTRNFSICLDNISKDTVYYKLISFLVKNFIYNFENYTNSKKLVLGLGSILLEYKNMITDNEANMLLNQILKIYPKSFKGLKSIYYNLYGYFHNIITKDNLISLYKKMVLIELSENDFEKAKCYLNKIDDLDSFNIFSKTHNVLINYKESSFDNLFKKYKYYNILEFNKIDEYVSLSKSNELINELFLFKQKYKIKKNRT